jgi:hypothetical protein
MIGKHMHRPMFNEIAPLDCADAVLNRPDLDVRRSILLWCVGLTVLYLVFFLILILRNRSVFLLDPDVYWHIGVGRLIWQAKALPHVDTLSHTFAGHAWFAKEWGSQLILFGAYTLDGWRGVALMAGSAIAFAYTLLFFVLARSMRVSVAFCISIAAFFFSLGQFNARPQIFADALIVIWFTGLVTAIKDKRAPSPILLLLMVLWANLHASFTFGLAMAGLLAAEAIFTSAAEERLRLAKQWATFLALATGAACLTPYGFDSILLTFKVFGGNEGIPYTTEWRPTTFGKEGFYGPIFLTLIFLGLYHGFRISFWRLLPFMFVLYMMFEHLRFAAIFALVAPILLVAPLTEQFPSLRLSNQIETEPAFFTTMTRVSRRWLYPACLAVMGSLFAFGAYGPTMVPRAVIAPAGAVDYIYEHRLTGNIYNPLNFGGYLIFRGIKTFIDGRTDQLFLENFMNTQMNVLQNNPSRFVSYLEQYNVTLALVIPISVEAFELKESPDWQMVYADSVSELFQKRSSNPTEQADQ